MSVVLPAPAESMTWQVQLHPIRLGISTNSFATRRLRKVHRRAPVAPHIAETCAGNSATLNPSTLARELAHLRHP